MKKFCSLFLSFLVAVCLFPTVVRAVEYNYFTVNTTSMKIGVSYNSNIYIRGNKELRAVFFKYPSVGNNISIELGFCCPSTAYIMYKQGENGSESQTRIERPYNGYYWGVRGSGYANTWQSFDYPVIEFDYNLNNLTANELGELVYDYTYGDNAEAEEQINWGKPANVMYSTRIAGSGSASGENIDRIVFSPEIDSNANELPEGARVQIRAIPGKYTGSTKQDVLTQTYTNFILDNTNAVVLTDRIVANGVYETKWSEVADKLSIPFASVNSIIQGNDYFYKMGWIYQIRLQIDEYFSDWVNIYTATSSGAQVEQDISNSDSLSQELIQNIAIVNTLNETTVNWYIQETEINMTEYTEPGQGDKPWWAYLLEALVSLFNKVVDGVASIVSALADLVGDIVDGILGLFTFDSFSIPDFTTNQQNLHQNSGIFGESIDLMQEINSTLSNADSTAEPILYYPGIDLDGVEFIPEITINLNDYVEDLGLTQWHNLAYTCTDIFIWTSLIYTIYRKLIGVFKK